MANLILWGRCQEIRDAVFEYVQNALGDPTDTAFFQLRNVLNRGAKLEKVWGDLRGEYFQNALKLNNIYIDVANDTVVSTKPKIEILLWKDSGMRFIENYEHFISVARKYWQASFYSNTVFPEIAAIFPLIMVRPGGRSLPAVANDYMIELTRKSRFKASMAILTHLEVTPSDIAAQLQDVAKRVDTSLLSGSGDSLNVVHKAMVTQKFDDIAYRNDAVAAYVALKHAVSIKH